MRADPIVVIVHVHGTHRARARVAAALRRADAQPKSGSNFVDVPVVHVIRHHWRPFGAKVWVERP